MADTEVMVESLSAFMSRLGDKLGTVQQQIASAASEEEMFSLVWSLKEAHECLILDVAANGKSEARATALKNQGNAHYHKKELKEALSMYNQSIMFAPHPPIKPDNPHPPTTSLAPPTNVLSRLSCSPSPPPPSIASHPPPLRSDRSRSQDSRDSEGPDSSQHDGSISTPEETGLDILGEEELDVCEDDEKKSNDDAATEKDDNEHIIPRRCGSKGQAPWGGGYKALALGYGNRSAVLCELGQYKQSLKDIESTLHLRPPTTTCPKLELRKTRCLAGLEERDDRELLQRYHRHNTALPDVNPALPWASNAITLNVNTDRGRYHKAITTILPGEVLMVERSYATCLRPEFLTTHCNQCLSRSLTPLPCPNCPFVVFCSAKCRSEAIEGSHAAECGMAGVLGALPAPWALACRVLARASVPRLRSWLPALWKELSRGDVGKDKKMDENEDNVEEDMKSKTKEEEEEEAYRRIFKLTNNRGKLTAPNLLHSCAAAFTLIKLLEDGGGFFVRANGESYKPSKEEAVMVGAALLRHLLALKCNAFTITETHLTPGGAGPQHTTVGVGVAAGVSLLNHSCRPTAFLTHSGGGSQVLTAAKTITSGEEITIDYLMGPRGESTTSRREMLQDLYGFECHCEACRGDVPPLPWSKGDLNALGDELVLKEASQGVGEREVWHHVSAAMERYKGVVASLQHNDAPSREDLEAVCDLIHVLDVHMTRPSTIHAAAMLTLQDIAQRSYVHVEVKDNFYF